MRPMARRIDDRSPASGRRASAASVADLISVLPAWWRVAAVASMMKYITRTLNAIPTFTSSAAYWSSRSVAPLRRHSCVRPMLISSSTSWVACQKNRYGEIVVPRIATSARRKV